MNTDWFKKVIDAYVEKSQAEPPVIVGIDPGETSGLCVFQGSEMIDASQIHGKTVVEAFTGIRHYMSTVEADFVVMEDYRVYGWKTDDHAWASLFTPKLIGALECHIHDRQIPLVLQMAQIGKGFCTDSKLQDWGFYQRAQRHSRDAIRHVCYYLLFELAKVNKNPVVKPTK